MRVRFCCFTPVPWPHLSCRPDSWPFPNTAFDASSCRACYDDAVEQLVRAEACGFDWVGMGEDHMTAYGLTPNPLLLLAVVAARTTRVRLAVMGCPVPLLNPVRVAEELAMLDVISGGRVVAGLIRGVPQNYKAYNVNPAESRARFGEAVDLIIRAWTERGVFAWESEHYAFPTVSIWPRPVQEPHPTVLCSANSVTSAEAAAGRRFLIGAIHLYNRDALDRVAEAIAAYRARAAVDGWKPPAETFLVGLQTCIAPTDQEAHDLLRPALDYQYGVLSGTFDAEKRRIAATTPGYGLSPTEESPPTLDERLDAGIVLCGSPETVTDQVRAIEAHLGVGVISMHMQVGTMPPGAVLRGMELFRDGVRPAFAQAAGAAS